MLKQKGSLKLQVIIVTAIVVMITILLQLGFVSAQTDFDISMLTANLSSEQIAVMNEVIALYPDGSIEAVIESAAGQGISVIGWNPRFLALEGIKEGEQVFFVPKMGDQGLFTRNDEARDADDLINGWVRYGGSMNATDGSQINLFTTLDFVYDDTPSYLGSVDLSEYQAEVDTFFNELYQANAIEHGETLNIILNDRPIYDMVGTLNTPELGSRMNYLGYQAAGPQNFAARKSFFDGIYLNTVSMDEINLTGQQLSSAGFAWDTLFFGISVNKVNDGMDIYSAWNAVTKNYAVFNAMENLYQAIERQPFVNIYSLNS